MQISVDLMASLYYFRLGLIQKENKKFALYDLDTCNMYEDMSIFYITSLLKAWTYRRIQN